MFFLDYTSNYMSACLRAMFDDILEHIKKSEDYADARQETMDNVLRAIRKLREFYKLKLNPHDVTSGHFRVWKDAQMETVRGQIRNELST